MVPWMLVMLACSTPEVEPTATESEVEDTADPELWEEVFTLDSTIWVDVDAETVDVIALLGNSDGAVSTWIYLGDGHDPAPDDPGPYLTTRSTDGDWDEYWAWFAEPDRDDLSVRVEDAEGGGRRDYDESSAGFGPEVIDGWELRAVSLEIEDWVGNEAGENDVIEMQWTLYGVPAR